MKSFILLILIFYSTINAQFKITFTDHSITKNGDIIVTVFAQNLGNSQKIWAAYGPNYNNSYNEMKSNFFLSYTDIIDNNNIRRIIPSSIVIKTIFGTSIPMDSPAYYFGATGLGSGQEWEITFTNMSLDVGEVSVFVLGSKLDLGDMPNAKNSRKLNKEKIISEISQAINYSQDQKWNEATSLWEGVIRKDVNVITNHKDIITKTFCEKAKLLKDNNNYKTAYEYFEKAKIIDSKVIDTYNMQYKRVQILYGEELINNGKIEIQKDNIQEGLSYFKSASQINTIINDR